MKTKHQKNEKCAKCGKPLSSVSYLEDYGWVGLCCIDEVYKELDEEEQD